MKITKNIVLTVVTVSMALASSSVLAYGKHHEHRKCGLDDKKGLVSQLNLTAEQQHQFNALRDQHRQAMRDQRRNRAANDRQALREQEQALILADHFDHAAATELSRKMVEKQVERRLNRLEKRHQMMSILTEEQKLNLQTLQQECRQANRGQKEQRRSR